MAEQPPSLQSHAETLLSLAEDSIRHGLEQGKPLVVEPADYPPELMEPRATFVTLTERGQLRGCIGSLEAARPLVADVAHNAYAAAFEDPRFPPVTRAEVERLDLKVEVLTPAEPVPFTDEADLIDRLHPGKDGLILIGPGGRRATFLPTVWETLPDPRQFLAHLKQKAGLPADFPAEQLSVQRYRSELLSRS
jgi:AmmeMemoRadiSam system protein A